MKRGRIVYGAAVCGYFLLILLPVMGFMEDGFSQGEPVWNGRRLGLVWNSFQLAFWSACGCVAVGVPAAVGIHNGRMRNSTHRWFFLLLAPVPYYIYALTWMCLIRMLGRVDRRWFAVSMTGLLPCVIVNIMAFLPTVTGLILIALEHFDRQQEEVACVYGAGHTVLTRVVLPAIEPFVSAAGILVFVLSVTDFSVPSLFQFQTYTLELFSEYSRGCGLGQVGKLALPLVLLVLGLVMAALGKIRQASAGSAPMGENGLDLHGIWAFLGRLGITGCVLQLLVPINVFVWEIRNWQNLWDSIVLCREQLAISVVIAGLASVTALALAGPVGAWMAAQSSVVRVLALFPVAVPSSLVAMGLLRVVNGSPFHWMSQTIYFPALGCAIKYMPFAALIFMARAERIPREELEMGKIYATSGQAYLFRVLLPAYRPAVLGAAVLVFLLALGEEGIALVLMPPGYETLAVKVYNYLHYGAGELVSGFCLVTVALTAGMTAGLGRTMNRHRHVDRRRRVGKDEA